MNDENNNDTAVKAMLFANWALSAPEKEFQENFEMVFDSLTKPRKE